MLGPTLPVVEDGRGSLDFNATLDPTENVTIAFSATNLLGAAATNPRQYDAHGNTYPWQTRFLETIYRVGVRFRFRSDPPREAPVRSAVRRCGNKGARTCSLWWSELP